MGFVRKRLLKRALQITIPLILLAGAYIGYSLVRTVRGIPEAYAAWDTGMLLIEYMKANDRRWPHSWQELLSVTNGRLGASIVFRGSRNDQQDYGQTLTNLVKIDWGFDTRGIESGYPVTRFDGSRFSTVWSGAEPNEMIRRYLRTPPSEDYPSR